jgi:uncharacterized membrane protein (UPF0127 family)
MALLADFMPTKSKTKVVKKYSVVAAPILIISSFVILNSLTPRSPGFYNDSKKAVSMKIETADEEAERVQGLSGRDSLCSKCGLLFVYDQPTFIRIWMKDMKFSIDIIWIDAGGKVIKIEKNVSPKTYPKVFSSDKKANFVLETRAGFADDHGVKVGSTFKPK